MIILAYVAAIFGTPIVSGIAGIPVMLLLAGPMRMARELPALQVPLHLLTGGLQNLLTFWVFIVFARNALGIEPTFLMFLAATMAFVANDLNRVRSRPHVDLEIGAMIGDVIGIWCAWFFLR